MPRRWNLRIAAVVLVALGAAACSSDPAAGPRVPPTTTTTTSNDVHGPATSGPDDTAGPDDTTDGTGFPTTTPPAVTVPPPGPVPHFVDERGFDDHTVPSASTVADLMSLARTGIGGQSAVKFAIPDFHEPAGTPGAARAHLFDSAFYELHDEWWYYRLLNGQPVPGATVAPLSDRSFATVDEVYGWAKALPPGQQLPLGLRWEGERLYSPDFYTAALHGEPRRLGVGSIVLFPDPAAAAGHWLIELEFTDVVTPALVAQYFERLAPILPPEVAGTLEWVVRSPQHDDVAAQMEAQRLPYHDRIVRFSDLVVPGTVGVYNEGITAGRLLYVGEDGADLGEAEVGDIVITEHVPDWLPQANALITSDPQTPLAHVNLLARNRGMPNASQGGIHTDAGVRQAARVRAHAIVITRGTTLQIALISRADYDRWLASQRSSPVEVPPVDITSVPYVVDLTDLVAQLSADAPDGMPTQADIRDWTPIIGGKSAGFLSLLSTAGLTPPPDPLAITVRAYVEHLAPLRDQIAAVIGDASVTSSAQARWLVLEGEEAYADVFASDADARIAAGFMAAHPQGTPIGDVLAAGGVRGLIEATPIEPSTLDEIVEWLDRTYADHDAETGLRFRSSSSVEDIEGFNGAGLYTSYTGFLRPELLDDEDDWDNTIERAILRAWASYWSFEAFEERREARIDHLSGSMGLTVHARFDDDLERNNGVATFTYLPGGAPDDAVLEINVQQGSVEVTNPDTQDVELPEVVRVTRRSGEVTIERISGSTLLDGDEQVLDDGAVDELFRQTAAVADVWRTRLNASLLAAQRVQTVVLDYEFKTVVDGWPKLDDGHEPLPSRLVLRQVRSLDPGLRDMSDGVRALPVPRDALMRASLVETVTCVEPSGAKGTRAEILTDPLLAPDMGHADEPLVVGPQASPQATCTRTTHFASPDRMLLQLLASGGAFVIVG